MCVLAFADLHVVSCHTSTISDLSRVPRGGAISLNAKMHEFITQFDVNRGGARQEPIQHHKKQVAENENPHSNAFAITKNELPQFIYMSIMMFLFIYVYTTVRDTKDSLVVSNCGAESIPFLKMYGVMPCAFLFIVAYSKLSQVFGKQALFYATMLPFFAFYAVFAFVMFPNRDTIHFIGDVGSAGAGAGGAVLRLIKYWSFSLYFIISELWASAGVPLLFWQVSDWV